jgi:hypothetical protein
LQRLVEFSPQWIEAAAFERALASGHSPHGLATEVQFNIPVGCKLMLVPIVRLLSLANQLAFVGKLVTLNFIEGETGAMGYLNRMGFFDHLSHNVRVVPGRPIHSAAKAHYGGSANLVEIAPISATNGEEIGLPSRLSDVVKKACGARADVAALESATWTIFSEMIGNVGEHSGTKLDGYAALQVYSGGNKLQVAVSDSGLGIMETLRPALKTQHPHLSGLSDIDLLVEIFRQGLSRLGSERGCGLKGCAARAIKFHAELDVRLPNQRVLLVPGVSGYTPNTAFCSDKLPLLWGTHISFEFQLT